MFEVAISADKSGIVEYWSGAKTDYQFPKCAQFDSKLDTDLFEFVRNKTHPTSLCFSKNGLKFATMSPDRKVRDELLPQNTDPYYTKIITFIFKLILYMLIVMDKK